MAGLWDALKQYIGDALPGGALNPETQPVAKHANYLSGILDPASQVSQDVQAWHKRTQNGLMDQLAGRDTPEAEQAYQTMMQAAGIGSVGLGGKIIDADAKLAAAAKKSYGKTSNINEAGYILPDGTMLDFSGRHQANPRDWPYLANQRNIDHRELTDEVRALMPKTEGYSEGMRTFMNQSNAVRNQPDVGFDTTFVPTDEQLLQLVKGWRGNPDAMYVDATHPETFDVLKSLEVQKPTVEKLRGLLTDAFSGYAPKAAASGGVLKPLGEKSHILRFANTESQAQAQLRALSGDYPNFKDFAVAPHGDRFAIWAR